MPKLNYVKNNDDAPMYYTFNNAKEKSTALNQFAATANDLIVIHANDRYKNVLPNISVKDGFGRQDYDWFRPDEATPKKVKDTMAACMNAHYHFSLVRNVIELMSDFASKGIRLTHKNKKIEKVYKHWFKKVNGLERSERFLNYLYRCGNVVVTRRSSKIKPSLLTAADANIETQKVYKNVIPSEYLFHNPVTVDVLNPELAVMTNKYVYVVNIPPQIKAKVKNPKTDLDNEIIKGLPKDILDAIQKDQTKIQLDPDSTRVFHYKKDDWQVWAYPLTSSILPDLTTLDKMKLADLTALDSATSKTRVWLLGDLDKGIIPGAAMIEAFKNILINRVPGDTLDLVWNPALKLIETGSDLSVFLGEEKYKPILSAIFSGLGVPSTLVAGSGDKGFTNNFISMKTLIERLQYGRDRLLEFWTEEIRIFQKAMGYSEPAQILFDVMNLSDESAEKALWVQLFDRNIVSIESVQERFGLTPEIEKYRVQRERKEMSNGSVPNKVGPYVEDQDVAFTKILLQNGEITASEAGVELLPKKEGEVTRLDKTLKAKSQETKVNRGVSGQGRPTNSKDSKQRKQKQVKPRTSVKGAANFVADMFDGKNRFSKINEKLSDVYLIMNNTDQIPSDKQNAIKQLSFSVLCQLEKDKDITEDNIKSVVKYSNEIVKNIYDEYIASESATEDLDSYIGFMYALYQQQVSEVD